MNRRRIFVTLTIVLALTTAAACGSSSKSSTGKASTTTTPTTTPIVSKAAGRGVAASTIKLGIALVDFNCISQFVDQVRVNQQEVYQAFISAVNDKGGINGRKIVPDFKTYCPLTPTSALSVQICTSFSDDDKVFAVMGNVGDAGQDDALITCLAKKHQTPTMTFGLTQALMKSSPPGMVVFPGTAAERKDTVLLKLLDQRGTLKGKKVAVLAQASTQSSVKSVILPELKKLNVPTGTAAYLTISGADTTAAHAQLASFIERWKSENVNAVYIAGEDVVVPQFVQQLSAGLPGAQLMTDVDDALRSGQDDTKNNVTPNPYKGMLIAGGYNPSDYAKTDKWLKYCKPTYEKYTHKVAPGPLDKVPGPNGKQLDTYGSINDACQLVSLFRDITTKMGPYVNADNWVATVDSLGTVTNYGGGPYASLKAGKYDFDDTFQLQEFDPTLPPNGNWKSLTPYENISN